MQVHVQGQDADTKDHVILMFVFLWSVGYCFYIYAYLTGMIWPTVGQGVSNALKEAYMYAAILAFFAFGQKYLQRALEGVYPLRPSPGWKFADVVSSYSPVIVMIVAFVAMLVPGETYFAWWNYQRTFAFFVIVMSVGDDLVPTWKRLRPHTPAVAPVVVPNAVKSEPAPTPNTPPTTH
ncbi:MAG: hypothetical protein JWO43_178 [Candidatus Adlerbacteria bacterium]|nr:hypothetical protein [Candidatus Adlerbacteria bacterium]